MIGTAIEYTAQEELIVGAFLSNVSRNASFWDSPVAAVLRVRIRTHYAIQQAARCCYCRQQIMSDTGLTWDVDHIVPKAKHPDFMFEPLNLAASCKDCNTAKRAIEVLRKPRLKRYPKVSERFTIVHPHFGEYEEHIVQMEHLYAPLSRKGEETIRACNLSRISQMAAKIKDRISYTRFEAEVDELFSVRRDGGTVDVTIRVSVDVLEANLSKMSGQRRLEVSIAPRLKAGHKRASPRAV